MKARLLLAVAVVATSLFGAAPAGAYPSAAAKAGPATQSCAYSAHSVAELADYSALVGRPVNCATVFNDSTASWAAWTNPWFTHQSAVDTDWAGWVRAVPGRQLVITQNMFPTSENNLNWLLKGSNGDYDAYARTLATNLVAAGLGGSKIRLGHEANGSWYADSVPTDARGQFLWRTFWRRLVTAMRSVPGAHFSFVWCVNYQVRNIPLSVFYPGNAWVDVIGLDAYDAGTTVTANRYQVHYSRAVGIAEVVAFARAKNRPMSFPEWGLTPVGAPRYGGGDDPGYVDGIAAVIASTRVDYESYWYAHADTRSLLQNSPASLAALRSLVARSR